MKLIEIEPYEWELYQDRDGIYLEIQIHNSAVSWSFAICLDQQAKNDYQINGKPSINNLAKRIESSLLRHDYDRFYAYPNVSKLQKEQMLQAFQLWKEQYT
jgi:pterin-4a-carbinolamine dehydratase